MGDNAYYLLSVNLKNKYAANFVYYIRHIEMIAIVSSHFTQCLMFFCIKFILFNLSLYLEENLLYSILGQILIYLYVFILIQT